MANTRIASIVVAGLRTRTKWVDHFVVECYEDAGLTTRVNTLTSGGIWDGQYTEQKDLMIFKGLALGQTYYLRCGVVTPVTGAIAWSSTLSVVAGSGSTSPNGVTYSQANGSPLYTASGVVLRLNIGGSLPADLDHFEAVWTLDGTNPTGAPFWSSGNYFGLQITFFAGIAPGTTASVFVRAVNTSHQPQPWTFIGNYQTGTMDHVLNGVSFGKVSLDGLTGNYIDPRKGGVIKSGSPNPFWVVSGFLSYTKTSAADGSAWVTWTWPAVVIRLCDGTNVTVLANTTGYTVGGLTAGATYYFYPYADAFSSPAQIGFVSGGGVGTDAVAFTATTTPAAGSDAIGQLQGLQSRMPMSNGGIQMTMPSAGGGGTGGGGGSGDGCPRFGMKVESRTRGVVNVETLLVGEEILSLYQGDFVWTKVRAISFTETDTLIRIETGDGYAIEQDPTTPMPVEGADYGPYPKSSELKLSDILIQRDYRAGVITSLTVLRTKPGERPFRKVRLTCTVPAMFFCGENQPMLLTHNILPRKTL
jgi:hypothetical protein